MHASSGAYTCTVGGRLGRILAQSPVMPVQSNTPQGSQADLAVAAARAAGPSGVANAHPATVAVAAAVAAASQAPLASAALPGTEIGGPKGPEPTRFGDWERAGRCIDF